MLIVDDEFLNKLHTNGGPPELPTPTPEREWTNEKMVTFLTKLANQTRKDTDAAVSSV